MSPTGSEVRHSGGSSALGGSRYRKELTLQKLAAQIRFKKGQTRSSGSLPLQLVSVHIPSPAMHGIKKLGIPQ